MRRRVVLSMLIASACLAPACGEREWFVEISDEVGLDFVHETGFTGDYHSPEIMGSGAALLDFDGDGDLDIYVTNGNTTLPDAGATTGGPLNQLYRQDADGRFTNVTETSGLGDGGYGMGVAVGDVDNDGDVDVYVSNLGRDNLYRNDGSGKFSNVTEEAGIDVSGWSTSATFLDYDRDGYLDLYVTRYVTYDPDKKCFDPRGRPDYCSPKVFSPLHDVVLHNEGDGTFRDASEEVGISTTLAAGLGVVCDDFDDDGWLDVYVANDAYANQLWINQGDGTFRDKAFVLGAAYNINGEAEAGMGVVAADFDNDGGPDLFMTHLGVESNTLYHNLGGGAGFRDASGESGLGPSSLAFTGFGTAALDVELDGDLDLVVANGRVVRGTAERRTSVPAPLDVYAEPNLFFVNDGSARFTLIERPVASLCATVEITRGLATGDIDRDGDLDILVSNIQGRARLYRNDAPRAGHWLGVRAVDPRLRRDALGARVTIHHGGARQVRTIGGGFSYLSSSAPEAHFGVGESEVVDRIRVRWPDGLTEDFDATPVDRSVTLVRGEGKPAA